MPSLRKKLTDEVVAALPIKARRYICYDTTISALGVRVGKSRKTWVVVTRLNGHTARKSVGKVGRITTDQARARARRIIDALEGEADIHITFGEVLDKLVDSLSGRRYPGELDRLLRRDVPGWMNKPIASITRREVIAALDARKSKKSRRPGKTRTESAAHHLLSYARRVFNFAVDRDIIEHAPTDRLKATRIIGARTPRSRVLDDDEIRRIWRAAEHLSPDYIDAIHLLFLTGARKSEVAHARRDEFKMMSKRWVLPAARTKQAAAHVVPMAPSVMTIVVERMLANGGDDHDYLFGRPLNGFGKALKKIHAHTGPMPHWTIHDIRRTMRTRLSSLRVPDHIAELAIGHARKGLQRTYDLHRFEQELREAFDAWAAALEAIVAMPLMIEHKAPAEGIPGTSLQGEGDLAPVPPAKSILAAS